MGIAITISYVIDWQKGRERKPFQNLEFQGTDSGTLFTNLGL
jgi:hypothetical protein